MANRKPTQTDEFKQKQYKAIGGVDDVPLAKKITALALPQDVQAELDLWPQVERITFLRSLITNAVREKIKQAG